MYRSRAIMLKLPHCIFAHVVVQLLLFLKWKPPIDISRDFNVRISFGLKTPNPRASNCAIRYSFGILKPFFRTVTMFEKGSMMVQGPFSMVKVWKLKAEASCIGKLALWHSLLLGGYQTVNFGAEPKAGTLSIILLGTFGKVSLEVSTFSTPWPEPKDQGTSMSAFGFTCLDRR